MSLRTIVLSPLLAALLTTFIFAQQPNKSGWEAVEDAIQKGLPKTAVLRLEPLIRDALTIKNYPVAIEAIAFKVTLQEVPTSTHFGSDREAGKIFRMRAEIDKAPEPMKPVMEAILAEWYWQYFHSNRGRIVARSQTVEELSKDFTTWDVTRLFQQVGRQFSIALSFADVLKTIPIEQYDDLLEKGSMPDSYRPTLYDFVAHEALQFYRSGEQAANETQYEFELSADSPIFSNATDFIAWQPATSDRDAPMFKAVEVYQQLLNFHRDDPDPSAYLDNDLLRLDLGKNYAIGDEKTIRYQAALRRFIDTHADHELVCQAYYRLAESLRDEGNVTQARELALQGMVPFPESVGAKQCSNVVQQIEAPEASVDTERVWNNSGPMLEVEYKNVIKMYFRLIKFNAHAMLKANDDDAAVSARGNYDMYLAREATHQWSVDLPATTDFRTRRETVPANIDVPPGSYLLFASHNAEFTDIKNELSVCEVWVSPLAIVTREHLDSKFGMVDGFVLEASSGTPLPDVEVNVRRRSHETNRDHRLGIGPRMKKLTTDQNGMFRYETNDKEDLIFVARHPGGSLATKRVLPDFHHINNIEYDVRFFTDRALYRPGQTIHFKGICVRADTEANQYSVMPKIAVTVILKDANKKEVARQILRSNDYGSFSGSFNAPVSGLTGSMSIHVLETKDFPASIRVEEYKRPKFKVTLHRPTQAYKLNTSVTVFGEAFAYTGANVDGGKVQWRVVREVSYPSWVGFRYNVALSKSNQAQEIAHGQTTTDSNGKFNVRFLAKPDASIARATEPNFRFVIYSDVTDSAGETRSAQSVMNIGYSALSASMTADDWQVVDKPVSIKTHTTTLDGANQAAAVVVDIYSLKQPEHVIRHAIDQRQTNQSNSAYWELNEIVRTENFETDSRGQATISFSLPVGAYRAMLRSADLFGRKVTAELSLQVVDPSASTLAVKVPELFVTSKRSCEPGETFTAIWGSGYRQARAFVEIEHRGKILQRFWTDLGTTQVAIKQKVDESMRGGFIVRTTMVRENRAYIQQQMIDVPWSNKELHLSWEHFVSKLQPAATETWTAIIKGADSGPVAAEMVATLYDASLDAFVPNSWNDSFDVFRRNRLALQTRFANEATSLKEFELETEVHLEPQLLPVDLSYRHYPDVNHLQRFGQSRFGDYKRLPFGGGGGGLGGSGGGFGGGGFGGGVDERSRNGAFGFDRRFAGGGTLGGDPNSKDSTQRMASIPDSFEATFDLENVSVRKNLNETAFFFPQMISGDDGIIQMQFTMPEALTQWRFLGLRMINNFARVCWKTRRSLRKI